jgi:hypothetical protein
MPRFGRWPALEIDDDAVSVFEKIRKQVSVSSGANICKKLTARISFHADIAVLKAKDGGR